MNKQLGRRGVLAAGLATAASHGMALARAGVPLSTPAADPCHAPFHAAFTAWLEGAAERLAFSVAAVPASPSETDLRVEGLHPAIWIALGHAGDINVGVTWEDVWWDLLTCPDVYAEEQPGGVWHNAVMLPEYRLAHPTIEAAWRTDGFEPLLDWLNDELAPATHLGLWRTDSGGCTWAYLVQDGEPMRGGGPVRCETSPAHLLPLHAQAPRLLPVSGNRTAGAGPVGSAVQRGHNVFVYDERGRQRAMLPAGDDHEDGLKGYTSDTVSIRRGANIVTYDARGRQLSMTPAR